MTTLREAAQQALERLRKYHYGNGFAEDAECIADLEAALAQQAEPVQEPVAWHYRNNGGASVMHWGPSAKLDADMQVAKEYPNAHKVTPLYTAPPQRTMVPLTEEDIDAEWRELDGEVSTMFMRVLRKFARAVEKASWEKNK